MIHLTRLNGKEIIINCEMIKAIESTPDTMLTLSTGEKIMIQETPEQVIEDTVLFKKRVFQEPLVFQEKKKGF